MYKNISSKHPAQLQRGFFNYFNPYIMALNQPQDPDQTIDIPAIAEKVEILRDLRPTLESLELEVDRIRLLEVLLDNPRRAGLVKGLAESRHTSLGGLARRVVRSRPSEKTGSAVHRKYVSKVSDQVGSPFCS